MSQYAVRILKLDGSDVAEATLGFIPGHCFVRDPRRRLARIHLEAGDYLVRFEGEKDWRVALSEAPGNVRWEAKSGDEPPVPR